MASNPSQTQYQGTTYPIPTDPNYYLSQTGLASIQPQPMTSNSMSQMFSPGSLSDTPVNTAANNPFLQLFMDSSSQALKSQRPQVGYQIPMQMG